MRVFVLALVLACPILLGAQDQVPAPTTTAAAQPAGPAQAGTLPIRRVILYKTGVGYFEHLGNIRASQNITIRFTSAQLNDVLKSLTAIDLGKGQVTGINYNSVAPLEQRLGALRLPMGADTTAVQLLGSLRGARLAVASGGTTVEGRLLAVERRTRQRDTGSEPVDIFTIVTDAGELRTFDLSPSVHIRVVERDLRQEIGRYLDLVGSAREQDVRSMVISTTGSGERQLFVSYISEVPIWKTTYRLVLAEKNKPLLQGWAIVDNTIGEDWNGVELSLVAGAPQSFIQAISQPYYGQRPVVPMPSAVLLTPQTHAGTLAEGAGTVSGVVRDGGRGALPGVRVRLLGPSGEVASTVTDQNGRYELSARAGVYDLRFEMAGFRTEIHRGWRMPAGIATEQHAVLTVGSTQDNVTRDGVSSMPFVGGGRGRGAGTASGFGGGVVGGVLGGVVGGLPEAPPPPPPAAPDAYQAARDLDPMAAGAALGDLFEYRIKEPITVRKNQSALVPIVNAPIEAERVSLWNRAPGSGRPLRAVWITNASDLTLDGGSMTIIDGNAFAGEGLIESLKPGERRLLSYAADLAVIVDARLQAGAGTGRVARVRARDGILIQETEDRATWTYKARNEDARPTTLIVEHRLRSGWRLAAGQTPAESTAGAERFRMTLNPKSEASLDVREVRQGQAQISIEAVDDTLILRLAEAGISAAALERQLRPVLDKRAEVATLERRLQELESERAGIAADQQRVRENMKALRGSAEEKQLLQRYTRQLDTQENRLDELRRELARVSAERDRRRAELLDLIRTVSFDITAEPAR